MADEFQTGICSGNWWNSTRTGFNGSSSPCSTPISDVGSFEWMGSEAMKTRSCEESAASVSSNSVLFQDTHKVQVSDSVVGGTTLVDSTLQMVGFGLSSQPNLDWSQALLRSSGRAESSFHDMLQEESAQIQKDFSGGGEMNQVFALDQQRLSSSNSCVDSSVTCQGLPASSFSMSLGSYGFPTTLLQGLFESELQAQQAPYENRSINNPSPETYRSNSSDILSSWPKIPQFLKNSPPKQQPNNHLHFSNNAAYWNASASAMNDVRSSFYPTSYAQFSQSYEEKPSCSSLSSKPNTQEVRDSRKSNAEPAFKRPRIETPSPLPTFKVRKEKLGDRITALQQLVSPFGKTDTASVLFEAIEYIRFLHDQVSALSTPYMKNGAPIQQHQQSSEKSKDGEGSKQDLRSRGLCLVPISSTFQVTNETTSDFWTPTFGGTFR